MDLWQMVFWVRELGVRYLYELSFTIAMGSSKLAGFWPWTCKHPRQKLQPKDWKKAKAAKTARKKNGCRFQSLRGRNAMMEVD